MRLGPKLHPWIVLVAGQSTGKGLALELIPCTRSTYRSCHSHGTPALEVLCSACRNAFVRPNRESLTVSAAAPNPLRYCSPPSSDTFPDDIICSCCCSTELLDVEALKMKAEIEKVSCSSAKAEISRGATELWWQSRAQTSACSSLRTIGYTSLSCESRSQNARHLHLGLVAAHLTHHLTHHLTGNV